MNFYVLVEELKPNSKAVEKSTCFHYRLFDPLQAFEVPTQGVTQRGKHGKGPLHGLSGKKQGRFNPKHIKTFQSSPSPLNISCSLQTFLWSQKPQLGTSSEERCFFSVLVFSYLPSSLHNKSFYLMCSPEPRRQREIQSCAIRNTPRTQIALLFLILSVGVSLSPLCQPQSGIQQRCPSASGITLTFLISFSLCLGNSVVSVMGRRCPCAISAQS